MVHLGCLALLNIWPVQLAELQRHAPAGYSAIPLVVRPPFGGLVVPASVAGREVRFLIDTGAGGTCVDERFAAGLGLRTLGTGTVKGVGAQGQPMRLVELKRFRLGGLPTQTLKVAALDLSWLNTDWDRANGLDIIGVIGSDLLNAAGAVIDCERRVLYVRDHVARDRQRLQGEWRAVSLVRAGREVNPTELAGLSLDVRGERVVLRTGRAAGVRVLAGQLIIHRNVYPKVYTIYRVEHLDQPKRATKIAEAFGVSVFIGEPPFADLAGRYELHPDKLVMTLPTDLQQIERNQLPPSLDSPPFGGTDLVTFERVPRNSSAADLPCTIRLPFALLPVRLGPCRFGGWEYTVTPDWSLTGTNAARKLRLTATLGGRLTLEPLCP